MNEQIKKLFTPVSDGLPEDSEWHHVVYVFDNKEKHGFAMLDTWGTKEKRFWNIAGTFIGIEPVVTHWLNLSKLTTKELAIELAEESYIEGRHNGSITYFIEQNKHIL
jgi:hypothetical protein